MPSMKFFMKNRKGEKLKSFVGTAKFTFESPLVDFYSIIDESESCSSSAMPTDIDSLRYDPNNPDLKRSANIIAFRFDPPDNGEVHQMRSLIAEPKKDKNGSVRKVFTGDHMEEKKITFQVSCQYRFERGAFTQFGTTKKVTFKFCPGHPAGVQLTDVPAAGLEMSVREAVDRLVVGCVDRFGHITAPSLGETWEMFLAGVGDAPSVLEAQPDTKVLPAYVCSTRGTAVFHSLQVRDMQGVGARGQLVEQALLITHTRSDGSSEPPSFAILEKTFPITLFPSSVPQSVAICWNGEPVTFSFAASLGDVISDLSFQIFDSNNDPMPYDTSWFDGSDCGVELSWYEAPRVKEASRKKKAAMRAPTSTRLDPQGLALPDLHLPTDLQSFPYECKATFYIFKTKVRIYMYTSYHYS